MKTSLYLWIDRLVVIAFTFSGLFFHAPRLWYTCLMVMFAAITLPLFTGIALTHLISLKQSPRLQGPRRRPALILRGTRVTLVASWIVACMAAWPYAMIRSGHPTGLVWSLAAAHTSAWRLGLQTLASLFIIDAYLYWKHRLLHTRAMFGFHRSHHVFGDPTTYASFAVGPIETLLTFWPVMLICIPAATHFAPVYFGLVGGFVLLNFYLHCGVSFAWIEATLPHALINTSVFHNRHHAKVGVNFGEALTLWDRICGTRDVEQEAPYSAQVVVDEAQ